MAYRWNGWTWEWTDDWGWPYQWTWTTITTPTYDPEKYDLVPKQEWIDEQIKLKEAQLKKLTDEHASRLKSLEDEISSLKGQKKALKTG